MIRMLQGRTQKLEITIRYECLSDFPATAFNFFFVFRAFPDYSGVSAVDSLPVPAGGAVHYKCPGVKTFKGKHDW